MHFLQCSTRLPENVLQTVCCKLQEDKGTGDFDVSTFVSPSLKRFHHLKTAARLICIFSIGLMDEF
jgi:hypothetical protein